VDTSRGPVSCEYERSRRDTRRDLGKNFLTEAGRLNIIRNIQETLLFSQKGGGERAKGGKVPSEDRIRGGGNSLPSLGKRRTPSIQVEKN